MTSETTKKFIKALAEEYGLPVEVIKEIVESPYLLHVHTMKNSCNRLEGVFPSTRIEGFGIFYSPDWKKQLFKDINTKNQQNE